MRHRAIEDKDGFDIGKMQSILSILALPLFACFNFFFMQNPRSKINQLVCHLGRPGLETYASCYVVSVFVHCTPGPSCMESFLKFLCVPRPKYTASKRVIQYIILREILLNAENGNR